MKHWPPVLVLVLTACACSQQAPVAHVTSPSSSSAQVSPGAPAAPSPAGKPGLPPTSPVPFQDLPLTAVGFSCRLPFYKTDALTTDGFITFPSGAVSADPGGNQGKYYDRAYSRWLPVTRSAVSPDGKAYAYIDFNQPQFVLHVVSVATGKDFAVKLSSQDFSGQPDVFDYSADGIYLSNAFEHLLAGMWLVNPVTGSIRQVSRDLFPQLSAGNGIIWTQVVNPADPDPVQTGTSIGTLPNEIDRVDLRTGTRTQWLYEPGRGLVVLGLDSRGRPLISSVGSWSADASAQLLLVAIPNSPVSIFKGVLTQSIGGGIADAHGTWFSGQRGIYLYSSSGALVKVSDHAGTPANGCF